MAYMPNILYQPCWPSSMLSELITQSGNDMVTKWKINIKHSKEKTTSRETFPIKQSAIIKRRLQSNIKLLPRFYKPSRTTYFINFLQF